LYQQPINHLEVWSALFPAWLLMHASYFDLALGSVLILVILVGLLIPDFASTQVRLVWLLDMLHGIHGSTPRPGLEARLGLALGCSMRSRHRQKAAISAY
jgi:hypothetical protein